MQAFFITELSNSALLWSYLEVIVETQLIPPTVGVVSIADALLTAALALRGGDGRLTVEHVGNVEVRIPGSTIRRFSAIAEH